MDSAICISVVVPARNEERVLPRLLRTVAEARRRFRGGAEAVEIVLADNGSVDATRTIALAAGCRVAEVRARVIASVRNGGAAIARGRFLAFVDADMQLHPETFNAIETALGDERIAGGASGIRPERWSLGIAAVFALTGVVGRLSGLEAGLAYLRRRDFETLGGYDERRTALEDIELLWRLRRLGRSRRQRLARLVQTPAIFSTRKFDARGDWHWLSLGVRMALRRGWRADVRTQVAEEYWYHAD